MRLEVGRSADNCRKLDSSPLLLACTCCMLCNASRIVLEFCEHYYVLSDTNCPLDVDKKDSRDTSVPTLCSPFPPYQYNYAYRRRFFLFVVFFCRMRGVFTEDLRRRGKLRWNRLRQGKTPAALRTESLVSNVACFWLLSFLFVFAFFLRPSCCAPFPLHPRNRAACPKMEKLRCGGIEAGGR